MPDSPPSVPSAGVSADIRVSPDTVAAMAAQVRSVGTVAQTAAGTFTGRLVRQTPPAIGDPATGDTLARTARLLVDAILAAGSGIDDLGRAMVSAADSYSLADLAAVPATGR